MLFLATCGTDDDSFRQFGFPYFPIKLAACVHDMFMHVPGRQSTSPNWHLTYGHTPIQCKRTRTDGCPDGNLDLISSIITTGCIQTCLCFAVTLSNLTNENLSKKFTHACIYTCSCLSWLLHNNVNRPARFGRFGLSRKMRCHESAGRRDRRNWEERSRQCSWNVASRWWWSIWIISVYSRAVVRSFALLQFIVKFHWLGW